MRRSISIINLSFGWKSCLFNVAIARVFVIEDHCVLNINQRIKNAPCTWWPVWGPSFEAGWRLCCGGAEIHWQDTLSLARRPFATWLSAYLLIFLGDCCEFWVDSFHVEFLLVVLFIQLHSSRALLLGDGHFLLQLALFHRYYYQPHYTQIFNITSHK